MTKMCQGSAGHDHVRADNKFNKITIQREFKDRALNSTDPGNVILNV